EPAHVAPGRSGASRDPAAQTSSACGLPAADDRGLRHSYMAPRAPEPLPICDRAHAPAHAHARAHAHAHAHTPFPWWQPAFAGGERAALAHLARYFAGDAAQRYKTTRNGLAGIDFSSKFSPWLAQGALSARVAFAGLRRHETERGANESTYWLWFELLWRDYFRFLNLQHGRRLYRGRGLNERASRYNHDPEALARWCR